MAVDLDRRQARNILILRHIATIAREFFAV
jgi:hypothetical protein